MERRLELLSEIYGQTTACEVLPRLDALQEKYAARLRELRAEHLTAPIDQRTALLITYGDQLTAPNETPLQTLVGYGRPIAERSPVEVTIALYRN